MSALVSILSDETGFNHEEAAELVQAITELREGFHEQIDGVINVLMIRYPPRSGIVLEAKET
jgi:hypothetical protein